MPEVVFKMVALSFEDVVIFVLGFPSGTRTSSKFGNIIAVNVAIANTKIVILGRGRIIG